MTYTQIIVMTVVINGFGAWLASWGLGVLYLKARHLKTPATVYAWGRRSAPVGVFYGVYSGLLASTSKMLPTGTPLRNADVIIRMEKRLGVWIEPSLSHLHVPGAWTYYMTAHLIVTISLLVYIGNSRPDMWKEARNSLALITGISLVCWWLWPVDPPRLLPASDGIAQHTLGVLDNVGAAYAVLPSLHTAWAAWVAVVLWRALPGRWRAVGPCYAALTAGVVLVTGNHYVTDVVVSEALALACGFMARLTSRPNEGRSRGIVRGLWGRAGRRARPVVPTVLVPRGGACGCI